MEVNWVLIAAAVLVVGLVLMNMQKSRFDDYGDEYAPVDTYDEEMYGDEAEEMYGDEAEEMYGDEAEEMYHGEEDYAQYGEDMAGDEAEAEDEAEDEDEDEEVEYAGDESDGEGEGEDEDEDEDDTDEVEDFTLMEPTIDDKYANALFTPPLL
jgi:hypothetical protein